MITRLCGSGCVSSSGADPRFEVVDAVASAEDAVGIAERVALDVAIVVDYHLGGRTGLWANRKLKRLPDPPAVLIYSAYSDGARQRLGPQEQAILSHSFDYWLAGSDRRDDALPGARPQEHGDPICAIAPGTFDTPSRDRFPVERRSARRGDPVPLASRGLPEFAAHAAQIEDGTLNGEVVQLDGTVQMPAR